jgi:predicted MFS family arabinose efflux permease
MLWTMSVASGVAVANLYYNQPMLADMARAFHATPRVIGLVATFTQIGYGLGMPVFVPLGDFVERRRLVVGLFICVACALAGAALAPNLTLLLIASFMIGLTTVITQILIPLAAELSSREEQGRTIGFIMSGALLGILLARTLSGVVAHHFGWRTMYWIASGVALLFAALLYAELPPVPARPQGSYTDLIRSILRMAAEIPKLRQVSIVGALIFATFSVFWTTRVFLLEQPPYHYGSQAAGLFGLIGAVGAFVAPLAGRWSDSRSPRFVVGIAISLVLVAYLAFWGVGLHIWGLVLGVIVLDAGVQAAQVGNQSRVLALRPDARSRVNTVYMITYFSGGSLGSLLGAWSWSRWHWNGVCATGIALITLGAIVYLSRGPEKTAVSASSS